MEIMFTATQFCQLIREIDDENTRESLVFEFAQHIARDQNSVDEICQLFSSKQVQYKIKKYFS